MKSTSKKRFDLLDGVRGLAALAVMVLHFTQRSGLPWLPGAGVAVDMFFVLSGFVIARSYGSRILEGMSFATFFKARLIRLMPLYLLGLALGLWATLVTVPPANGGPNQTEIAKAAALGLFMLPYFNQISWPFAQELVFGPIFPLNGPSWSLFFELFVNILFFFVVVKYRRTLHIGILLGLICLYFLTCARFNNPGWGYETFIGGFPRVIAGFFVGVWISDAKLYQTKTPAWMAYGLILASFSAFALAQKQIQLANIFFIVPALIICCAGIDVHGALRRGCSMLGELSYPLYVIHMPIYQLLYAMPKFLALPPLQKLLGATLVAVPAAFVLIYLDRAVRAALARKLLAKTSPLPMGGSSSTAA
ncbi:acyltransferase family protein [Pseudoduganella violacea]|uniref:Peptidoglycan/LPS O-acetylase OafA/YrhL n=1 Tax=Pseudoduganella violacea TaxID=1715466 RepID=A0A7W5BBD9_9BURK|nr:acyltransferase [Pseudoduganella violacea]MBB3120044.1 peptidoglycan/LPS O-acetylase OafA/YrhL [Pseudoduganella violacea]